MIELRDVATRSGAFVLSKINMVLPRGRYAVLMGGTGQGKTTILEAIALRAPDEAIAVGKETHQWMVLHPAGRPLLTDHRAAG